MNFYEGYNFEGQNPVSTLGTIQYSEGVAQTDQLVTTAGNRILTLANAAITQATNGSDIRYSAVLKKTGDEPSLEVLGVEPPLLSSEARAAALGILFYYQATLAATAQTSTPEEMRGSPRFVPNPELVSPQETQETIYHANSPRHLAMSQPRR